MKLLRLGTRRSPLALWQANFVREQLTLPTEMVTFTTEGDRQLDKNLAEIGGKGLFTTELEQALLQGEIEMAVHSLKDLPTLMAAEFTLGAILLRANPLDALVSRDGAGLDELPSGAVIGTSSLRRAAQLKAYRPDLQIQPIRGNVETRLRKVFDPQGSYAATLLAVAGLERLNQQAVITQVLDPQLMLPAPGQGALAVQCRADDAVTLTALAPLDDAATRACVVTERAFLQHLEAGCSLPVAAYATLTGQNLYLRGRVSSLDGGQTITIEGHAAITEPIQLGIRLAQQALDQGAASLMARSP